MNLTKREYQILELVTKGNSDKQIADKLKISSRTVQTHLGRIYIKLGVKRRVGAVALFVKHFASSA